MDLKPHLQYRAHSKWNHQTGGQAQTDNFTIHYDTPKEYQGEETAPCPDQLFLASLAGCLNNTFLYYKNILKPETHDLTIDVTADIKLHNSKGYRLTKLNINIQVWSPEEYIELNQTCAERAREYCHLTRSIEPAIPIESKITVHTT